MADEVLLRTDIHYWRQEHAIRQEEIVRLEEEVVRLKKMVDDVIVSRKKLVKIINGFQRSLNIWERR
jgi:hypothetical protein|tara:strand:- start:37 stop:237 length:201 start_codon:yes stop_codon:yes gene_type:complete